ncbi:GNAT family N-acetyltransferase [Solirhodobacter olei]|uniref:GNAT family N-acetyltransferase n=1 Tax=Solirhodobacter olei TaxID=2493082 RepID=UPI000FDBD60A|nr:GNAT family N-acetyltransferase [Solirhodobacter olei]
MELRASILESIHDVDAEQWDRCCGPDDLLVSHRHLAALEDSGVAGPENGFTSSHVVLRDARHRVVAVAPAYLKSHNEGEMGVDMGLRLAHERLVGSYFPKLQVEVPFTTFSGTRFLVRPNVDRTRAVCALIGSLKQLAADRGASSVQIAYLAPESGDPQILRGLDMAISESNTFVWRAGDDMSFSEYVAGMTGSRRQRINRERRQVQSRGLDFRYFRGGGLQPEMASQFFDFYVSTFARHANKPPLNMDYFRRVFETMPESVDLSVSIEGNVWAGASMSINGSSRGRALYWGQAGDIPNLHFEQFIYRSIERGFVTGLDVVDFGGIGEHKGRRGLVLEPMAHAFWFTDAAMRVIAEKASQHKCALAEAERVAERKHLEC